MKILYTSIFTLFFTLSSIGQNTFNIRTNYGFPAAVLSSVIPTDSCIYASGIIADSVFPYNTGAIFIKMDVSAQMLLLKTLTSTQKTFEPWFGGLKSLPGGSFIMPAYSIDSTMKTVLIKYNHLGDTIFTKEYFNPFYPAQDFIQPRGRLAICKNGECVINNWIVISNANTNIYLIKTDSNGKVKWSKMLGDNYWERPSSILATDNGCVVVGGIKTNDNMTTENFSYRTFLTGLDTSGQIQWTWLSPESWGLRDAARDMVLLEDGSLVIASGIGHEQQRPSVNVVYFDKAVFKLNPQRELEWEVVFPDPELVLNSYTSRIIQLKNKSGFVVAGVAKRPTPPGVWGSNRGWIAKISPDGDSLWSRTYVYSTDFPSFHEFYDLKECPDGGLILCGESRSVANGDSIPQQAWLMKLDSFGCLVPGCQFIDATEETKESVPLLLYPKPARDYLNFFYRPAPGQSSRDIRFRIIDASGMELQRFEAQSGEATYIVPLWHWPPGVYFLQLLREGVPVRTERFVVAR